MEKIYAMNELQAIICPILRDYGVGRLQRRAISICGLTGAESAPCSAWAPFTMN